jgi:hypothetical protein
MYRNHEETWKRIEAIKEHLSYFEDVVLVTP